MMCRWKWLAMMLLCVESFLLLCTAQAPAPDAEFVAMAKRRPAPDFTLTDLNGKRLTLTRYKGKVVLLDFWAVNCGGCKKEVPWYVAFDAKYHDAGLALMGLDMYGESPELVKPFLQQAKVMYPVAIGTDAIGERYGLKEMPLTVLIDRKGRVAVSHAGVVDKDVFEADIRRLLAE